MDSFLYLGCTTLAVIAASLLFDWWYFQWSRRRTLPPGPPPWPIIGNALLYKELGPDLPSVARGLVSRYGKIMTFWLGKRPIILVSDAGLANDALVKQGAYFANRVEQSSKRILSAGFMTMSNSQGPLTAALRKNIMTHMLGPVKLKGFKRLRDAAYDELISDTMKSARASEGGEAEVNIQSIAYYPLLKITLVLIFGVELEDDFVQELMPILDKRLRLLIIFMLGDFVGIYKLLERKMRGALNAYHMKVQGMFETLIDKVRHLQGDDSVIKGNYCETLFELEKEFPAMNNSVIASLCSEFIDGSVHTTVSSVDNAIALLSDHPQVQMKLYEEIQTTVGSRIVDESDLPQLPYLSAVVRESLRRNPTIRLAIPHATSELRKLGGYDIPTDAVIIFHLEAFLLNPDYWSDPFVFRPERFLENDIDVHGIRDCNFLPFGAGRRACPGAKLAMLEVSTAIARLVQAFEWRKRSNVHGKSTLHLSNALAGYRGVLLARPRSV